MSSPYIQRGVGLIEVLVALLLLAMWSSVEKLLDCLVRVVE